eukprot:4661164-Prymnesium_polylepis.1
MHDLFGICPANNHAGAYTRGMDKGICFREAKEAVPFDDDTDSAVVLRNGIVVNASIALIDGIVVNVGILTGFRAAHFAVRLIPAGLLAAPWCFRLARPDPSSFTLVV